MRLLKKKTVFLQSANAGSGTIGNFSIDLPSDNTFEEDHPSFFASCPPCRRDQVCQQTWCVTGMRTECSAEYAG